MSDRDKDCRSCRRFVSCEDVRGGGNTGFPCWITKDSRHFKNVKEVMHALNKTQQIDLMDILKKQRKAYVVFINGVPHVCDDYYGVSIDYTTPNTDGTKMTNQSQPQIGDYVLATKWDDGDPCDHWCIGYYAGSFKNGTSTRHLVVNNEGKQFRLNGFRRVKSISRRRGKLLLQISSLIENSVFSVWHWAGRSLYKLELIANQEGNDE